MDEGKKDKKRKLWKIPVIIICTLGPVVAWLVFGEQGLLHLYHTELERQAYIERIRQLTEENQALLDEINRLRTDMEYVESVARRHFYLVKPNEVIYRFDNEKQGSNDVKDQREESPQREELNDGRIK